MRSAVAIAPGVHERIERPVRLFVEHDRVERLAGRLDADFLEHRFAAMVFERQAEHERLRHRLNAEQLLVIADVEDLAVDGDDGNAEPIRVGQRQLGNVVGDFAVVARRGTWRAAPAACCETARPPISGCRSDRRARR